MSHRDLDVEYKVVIVGDHHDLEEKLCEMAADGWGLVTFSENEEYYTAILVRAKDNPVKLMCGK